MQEFIAYIDEIQDFIFTYKFKDADKLFSDKLSLWEEIVTEIATDRLEEFNQIMLDIFSAKQKQDHLLLADFFEFKLKPFLGICESAAGGNQ